MTDRKRAEEAVRAAEERSEFVREASGVGFWYCDLPFDVLEWDERVKQHFWLPPDARVTIDTFYARIRPDDREPTRRAIEQSIADRAGYDVHYRTVHPGTGEERWVRAIGRTSYAADGTPARFDGVTLDVTAERRAADALRASEERYRVLATATSDVVYRMSPDWAAMYPLDGRGLVASNVEPIRGWLERNVPADEHARVRAAIDQAVATREPFELEHRVTRPDGSTGWTLSRAAPILGRRRGRGRVVRDGPRRDPPPAHRGETEPSLGRVGPAQAPVRGGPVGHPGLRLRVQPRPPRAIRQRRARPRCGAVRPRRGHDREDVPGDRLRAVARRDARLARSTRCGRPETPRPRRSPVPPAPSAGGTTTTSSCPCSTRPARSRPSPARRGT